MAVDQGPHVGCQGNIFRSHPAEKKNIAIRVYIILNRRWKKKVLSTFFFSSSHPFASRSGYTFDPFPSGQRPLHSASVPINSEMEIDDALYFLFQLRSVPYSLRKERKREAIRELHFDTMIKKEPESPAWAWNRTCTSWYVNLRLYLPTLTYKSNI